MSLQKFLLNLDPFISILRLKISLWNEHCFNPRPEKHSVTKMFCLPGKQPLAKKQTMTEMPKCP